MLVSAAMAERPRAAAPGRSQVAHPAPGAQRTAPSARHSTARVSTTQGVRRSELPGWFWGALGCLTVLVVGLSVVFLMGQAGPAPTPPAATAKAVEPEPAPKPPAPAARPGPGATDPPAKAAIKIEPMAAPAPAAAAANPPAPPAAHAAKTKASRPIKVARSPGGSKAGGGEPAAAANDTTDDDTEDAVTTTKRPSAEDEATER